MVQRTAEEAYEEAPELSDAELAEMRPAREVHSSEEFAALTGVRKRGRPLAASKKVPVTIRLNPDTVAAFKAMGNGWQTRMNEVLAVAAARLFEPEAVTPEDPEKKTVKKKRTRAFSSRKTKRKAVKRVGKAKQAA